MPLEVLEQLADLPPSPTVCPQCGGRKTARKAVCSKCERLNALDQRVKAAKAPPIQLRDQFLSEPPGPAPEPVLPSVQEAVESIAEHAQDLSTKKIQGWDADDLDMVAYLLTVAVFCGVGWAVSSSTAGRKYAPRYGDCQAMCVPLARVIARRVKVPGMKSGDAKDVIAILAAAAAYGMHCYNVWQMDRDEDEERARNAKPVMQQIQEAITPPIVVQSAAATTPPPNGNGQVVTGRAAIPPAMRATLQSEGKL